MISLWQDIQYTGVPGARRSVKEASSSEFRSCPGQLELSAFSGACAAGGYVGSSHQTKGPKGPKPPTPLSQLLKNSQREVKRAHFRYKLGPPGPTQEMELMGPGGKVPPGPPPPPGFSSHACSLLLAPRKLPVCAVACVPHGWGVLRHSITTYMGTLGVSDPISMGKYGYERLS